MECSLQTTWTVKLSAEQMTLISRALRGCLRDTDAEKAKVLGDEISLMRAKYMQHLAHENEKLIRNLKEAGVIDG